MTSNQIYPKTPINQIFYHSSTSMNELNDESVDLIITSPSYCNIK